VSQKRRKRRGGRRAGDLEHIQDPGFDPQH
jgi:hypothetical protein